MDHKLNFNHKCLAAAGKEKVITGGSECGHIHPSQWGQDLIQGTVTDNLMLQVEVAEDQLEGHQRRATRET